MRRERMRRLRKKPDGIDQGFTGVESSEEVKACSFEYLILERFAAVMLFETKGSEEILNEIRKSVVRL